MKPEVKKIFTIHNHQEWTNIQNFLLTNPNTKWNGSDKHFFLDLAIPEHFFNDPVYIIQFSNDKICYTLTTESVTTFILNNPERCQTIEYIDATIFIRKEKLKKIKLQS